MIERRYLGPERTLEKVLSELFPEVSYSELRACLRRKDVKIEGVRASAATLVPTGSKISLYPKNVKSVKVLYEDDFILACYKPKGIASEGEASFETLVAAEKGQVKLTHRLDTNTDGVLLFAKTEEAYREIFAAMKAGSITKEYTAEVYGHPSVKGEITLNYFYKKDAERGRAIVTDHPRSGFLPVTISFTVSKLKQQSAVLLVKLHKGKTHQIRAMLAFYGHFILGDGKYGKDEVNRMLGVKKTLLTATSLRFSFPEGSPLFYLNDRVISL